MKFFAVFSALLAVTLASPSWDMYELSAAIQDPSTDPALIPVLEQALNDLMYAIYHGSSQDTSIAVATPAHDLSSWTLHELSEAIQDPATNAELLPYLEKAINSLMAAIMSGNNADFIIIATPAGLLPVEAVVAPTPVEAEIVPSPVEEIVVPPTVAPASSPLVQIIVNVKSQQAVAPVVPSPVVLPNPIVPEAIVLPMPTLPVVAPEVVPEPVVLPMPVLPVVVPEIVPEPVVVPMPVLPVVNPAEIIAVNPVGVGPVVNPAVNPAEIIAVNPAGVNPVDIISPMPVLTPINVIDGIMV